MRIYYQKSEHLINLPSGLSLSVSCWRNSLAEKEVITSWILAGTGRSFGKGQQMAFRLRMYNDSTSEPHHTDLNK